MVLRSNKISIPARKVDNEGWAQVHDYTTNKGLSYSPEERDGLSLRGLLPARVLTQQEQLDWCVRNVERIQDKLEKYIYLRDLQDSNENLFYQCLIDKINIMLPIVYTPIVGLACQNYGLIYRRPRGMFITINDMGHIEEVLRNWPTNDVKAIVVTDGERILGLGDLGANGMAIPVGKMAIYTALGGIKPEHCLPITLDVGTNNKKFLEDDSTYIGLQQRRVTGEQYNEFIDEFMRSVVKVFGRYTLIQFEDFVNENAFKFLARYRKDYTMFNDDIQGTASVTVAGLLAAERFTGKKISESKVLFVGAGTAVGIANLIVTAMGGDPQEARKRIFMKRSKRLVVKGDENDYEEHDDRRLYCHEIPEGADTTNLVDIIQRMKPDILIGVSGSGKLFTTEVLEAMAESTDRPIIFPLSNPTDKAECTAEEAYKFTKGKCLFASGSPFPPVEVNGSMRYPQQCNNAYIFPGVALAVTTAKMSTIPEEVFFIAAKTLANKCMKQEDFDRGSLYPPLERLRHCSVEIAADIVQYAFDNNLTTLNPKPADIKAYILSQHYSPHDH